MRKHKDFTVYESMKEFAEALGIDYYAAEIKMDLVDKIRDHCAKNKLSQRKLAALVPGLTQDRVSKLFSGLSAGMTIDKLVQILHCLNYKVEVRTKALPKRVA